ncbi:MAG: hypothetical protein WKF63_06055 [Thermomicrobiales bacterium]
MFTIVAIALVLFFGLLFASMAIAPVLIESNLAKPSSRGGLVLVAQPANPATDVQHREAA